MCREEREEHQYFWVTKKSWVSSKQTKWGQKVTSESDGDRDGWMDVCQSHACTNPSPVQSYYNPNTQAKLSFVTLCLVTILSVSATKVEPKSLLWHMHISTLSPLYHNARNVYVGLQGYQFLCASSLGRQGPLTFFNNIYVNIYRRIQQQSWGFLRPTFIKT